MLSWGILQLPSHTDFSFSWTTPDGTVKTGDASVDIEDGYPDSLDFYVEPAGVRAEIVPRAR
jgi:hypothetical protein